MINRARLLAEFCELIKIDSPTRKERPLAEILETRLRNMNMTVTEDQAGLAIGGDCGNVFAYLKGTLPQAPVLMLSAHMDTVDPCQGIEPILREGRFTSQGPTILGADDKSGIAPILEALRTVQELNIPHGDIQVVFSVAEEGGLNGSKNLDQSLLKADYGYVLDATGEPGTIILAAPGQDQINITITGKAAHAGVAPEEGISAIVAAAQAISSLKTGRIDGETTSNVGTIEGGLATNIVAERVEVTCETRSRSLKKLEMQTAQMVEVFKRCSENAGAQVEIEVIRMYDPYEIEEGSSIVAVAVQAAKAAGLRPRFTATGGGSDANYFNKYGLPCVVLGTGMEKTHTTEECLAENNLYRCAELVVEIIKAAAEGNR